MTRGRVAGSGRYWYDHLTSKLPDDQTDRVLTPIRRQSLSDAVYEQLKTRIVRGEMPAGASLPAERALCASLGVNRGAVREALKRLEQAGLVRIQHGGGTHVRDFEASAGLELLPDLLLGPGGEIATDVARSVLEMRTALAKDVAFRAAQRRRPEQVEALSAHVEGMRDAADDLSALQRIAMAFWSDLVLASHNIAYRLAFNTLARTYEPIFEVLTQALALELNDIDGYAGLADAVLAKYPEEARALADDLTSKGQAGLLEVLAALDAAQADARGREADRR